MALDAEKNQATALAVAEKMAFTVEVNAKNQAVGLSVAEKNQATASPWRRRTRHSRWR